MARFETVDEIQNSLDDYLAIYNAKRPRQGRSMSGKTPAKAFVNGLPKPATEKGEKPTTSKPEKQAA